MAGMRDKAAEPLKSPGFAEIRRRQRIWGTARADRPFRA
jgi:hypothetical protein